MKRSTLKQIFDVLKIFKQNYNGSSPIRNSYSYAVREVAKHYGVAYQTIGDGCRRRLNLTNISEFYELLRDWYNGKPERLISILKRNSEVNDHSEIDKFFGNIYTNGVPDINSEQNQYDSYSVSIQKKDSKILSILSEVYNQPIPEYLTVLVTDSLRLRMKEYAESMVSK